jgi:ABC-2 type transport system permease protein
MSNFTNILKKEVKELITPQMIGSMIFMVVFFVFMGYMIGGITKEAAGGEVNLAILDQDKSQPSKNIIDTLAKQANVTINALEEMR